MSKVPIFLAILLSLFHLTNTLPQPRETSALSSRDDAGTQTRSVSSIVYSCLFTILLCSSYCIRPNLSSPSTPRFFVLIRKINIAFWIAISPELVILWAFKQWYYARNFAEKYKDRGWAVSHGHFAVMGGFILSEAGRPIQVLSLENFNRLYDAGYIELPSISEQDIKAKGKPQPLLAAITFLQTAWFLIQFIARRAYRLDITQLEMVTLYLVAAHAMLLLPWWNKPLDTRAWVCLDYKRIPSTSTVLNFLSLNTSVANTKRDFERQKHVVGNHMKAIWDLDLPLNRKIDHRSNWLNGVKFVLGKLFFDYAQLYSVPGTNPSGAKEVPLFYVPNPPSFDVLLSFLKIILGSVVAVPYFSMWSAHFPTPHDANVWRVASVISASFPIFSLAGTAVLVVLFMIVSILTLCLPDRLRDILFSILLLPAVCAAALVLLMMIGAKMALITEAFICLTSLSTTARLAVPWTDYIPHLS